MGITLSPACRRKLESALSLAGGSLERIERLLAEGARSGIVRSMEDNLSLEDRNAFLEEIRKLKGALCAFSSRFELQVSPPDIRRVIGAELASAWVVLEGCRPERFKEAGVQLNGETQAGLGEAVDDLVTRLLAIRSRIL